MIKKGHIKTKNVCQLSFSFPVVKTVSKLKITDSHTICSKENTPVISINRKTSLSHKAKSDYINLVLKHTKSF